jgi:hypothetical protein
MRNTNAFVAVALAFAASLAVAGCFRHIDVNITPDAGSPLSCGGGLVQVQPPLGSPGQLGRLRFTWSSAEAQSLSAPIAVGAKLHLSAKPAGTSAVLFDRLEITDTTIATIPTRFSAGEVDVHALAPGVTEVVAFDASDQVVDRTTLTAAAVDTLAFMNGWGAAPGPTVAVAAPQRYLVHLMHGAQILVGNGLTHFTYTGPLSPAQQGETPAEFLPNTEENFAVGDGPGAATITATSGAATVTLPVTLIAAADLTDIDIAVRPSTSGFLCAAQVTAAAVAASGQVYAAKCTWSHPTNVSVLDDATGLFSDTGGWTGDDAAHRYLVLATEPGTYTLTCTLRSDLKRSVDVTLTR